MSATIPVFQVVLVFAELVEKHSFVVGAFLAASIGIALNVARHPIVNLPTGERRPWLWSDFNIGPPVSIVSMIGTFQKTASLLNHTLRDEVVTPAFTSEVFGIVSIVPVRFKPVVMAAAGLAVLSYILVLMIAGTRDVARCRMAEASNPSTRNVGLVDASGACHGHNAELHRNGIFIQNALGLIAFAIALPIAYF